MIVMSTCEKFSGVESPILPDHIVEQFDQIFGEGALKVKNVRSDCYRIMGRPRQYCMQGEDPLECKARWHEHPAPVVEQEEEVKYLCSNRQ
jgi:hypothetical protein